ncbi:MAG: acetate--CoA ligase family protein, partial [Spirochaetota bacterium]
MEKFFNPQSIAIIGVTEKKKSIPRYILDNTQRWGYSGKIYGVTPGYGGQTVQGIPVYEGIRDLPEIPELAVLLIPAKFVPVVLEECGKFGIKRVAILSGGFNESGESGASLAEEVKSIASQYNIRFLGPNGLSVADAVSGVCLPFVPHQKMKRGGFSLISQSGGFFLVLWNMMRDENMGMARFVSIGNKLNVDECDMLEYLGSDPETKVIGMYLESIQNGERLVEVASKIDKPIIAIKANRSEAGSRAAMSHTASMSNNDSIVDAAFERAGIIRVEHINDLVTVARAFELPPMRGERLMVMTPGGGSAVMMADLAEKNGFTFADPGKDFFEGLNRYTNAGGIIRFSNPLDMGDIYDIHSYPEIIGDVLHSDGVDGAVYGHAWPLLPEDDDSIFKTMFHTDISEDVIHTMEAAGKPLAVSMSASTEVLRKMKHNLSYPIFDRVEDAIWALRKQADFYAGKNVPKKESVEPVDMVLDDMELYLQGKSGDIGEDMLFPLMSAGIDSPQTVVARDREEAI